MYISLFKVAIVVAAFLPWCLCAQWVDRDGVRVKTLRERWNLLVLGTGALGLLAWLMIPWLNWAWFFVGLMTYLLVAGGGTLMYVSHRNKRVSEQHRVLTAAHLSHLLSSGNRDPKLDRSQHEYRVRLFNHDKKPVSLPDDLEAAAQFSATQEVLYDAMWRRATDIDLAVSGDTAKLTYVIDGVLAERRDFINTQQAQQTIRFVKHLANLQSEERRRPQHGLIRAALLGSSGDPARIDVHTSGTTAGERISLKITTSDTVRSLSELGIHPQRLDKLREIIKIPSGMVICSGPPQSGITTTLYAIVKSHDAYIQNIHSLELRKLFEVENITQHAHDVSNREVSYARQLQSVLRREPDVVLVGEMDDKETAQISTKAAGEGKKIYAGITAGDSFEALDTYLSWVKDRRNAARTLLAVTGQRLLRKLCPTCREAYRPDSTLLRKANLPVDEIEHFYRPPTQKIYDKQGREIVCPTCQGTGYVGRIGVYELLVVDDDLRAMVKAGANTTQIKAQARKNKMYYIQEEGLLKTMEGTTSMNEVLRALRNDRRGRS